MIWSYAWKGFARRKTRAWLAVIGITMSIAILVAVGTISHAVETAISRALDQVGADLVIYREKQCAFNQVKLAGGKGEIPASVVDQLVKTRRLANAAGVLELWCFDDITQSEEDRHPTVVTGMDPAKKTIGPARAKAEKGEGPEAEESCCAVLDGRFLEETDDFQAMVTQEYARAKGLQVGDPLQLGPHRFEVVALLDMKGAVKISGAEAFIPLRTAQLLLDRGEVVTTIFVSLKRGRDIDLVQAKARELVPDAKFSTKRNIETGAATLAATTRRTLLAISGIVVFLVLMLVVKTAVGGVADRVAEIGIMKATGWRNADVSKLLTAEALFPALIGGLVGCLFGLGLAVLYGSVFTPKLPESLQWYPKCSVTTPVGTLELPVGPDAVVLATGLVAALVIGSASGYFASRRALRLRPAEALRTI